MSQGLIFDIKRFAINDGPGIRLTVFFKGCPLSCLWCHNPESKSSALQKMYTASKCIGSKACVENCPNNALVLTEEGIITDYENCNLCGICAEVCPSKAFEMIGNRLSVTNLMKEIDKEAIFFDQSNGGVTFSGGEPLMHSQFLLEALKECGKRMYHRVVDTSAYAKKEILREVANHTELFLIDLKVMDSEKHRKYTGVPNELILSNIRMLTKIKSDIIFRMPLISPINTDELNIVQTATFIKSLKRTDYEVNLLPYHHIAKEKNKKLGLPDLNMKFESPSKKEIQKIRSIFDSYQIKASIGG